MSEKYLNKETLEALLTRLAELYQTLSVTIETLEDRISTLESLSD